MITRRGIITGLGAMVVAPAIVRASILMPVKPMEWIGVDTGGISVGGLLSIEGGIYRVVSVEADGLIRVEMWDQRFSKGIFIT